MQHWLKADWWSVRITGGWKTKIRSVQAPTGCLGQGNTRKKLAQAEMKEHRGTGFSIQTLL